MSITFTWNNPNTNEYTPEFTVIYRAEAPFEADDLPVAYATMPGATTSYTDDDTIDDQTYFYRVGFKLGIKEMVSRLIEIKAPTTPDFFTTVVGRSVTSWSQYTNSPGINNSDMAVVIDSLAEAKWPVFIGEAATAGSFYTYGLKVIESMLVRIAAMVAIQKFRRSVWLTEGFERIAPSTLVTISNTSNDLGWYDINYSSGVPVGAKFTWQEAFNFVARCHTSMDICLNIIHHLKNDILISFTTSRGRIPAVYNIYQTIAVLMDYVYGLGQARGSSQPFRGFGTMVRGGAFTPNDADRCAYLDGMPVFRIINAVFKQYPEIKNALLVNDQTMTLPYRDASDNVVDFFSTGNNARDYSDPIQFMVIPTGSDVIGASQSAARNRELNGNVQTPPDSVGMASVTMAQWHPNGNLPASFFMTTTPNGKDFASLVANGHCGSRQNFDQGQVWLKASALTEVWTDGLSTIDPMESQVVLRYIPSSGLTDLSSRGTTLEFLGGGLDFLTHSSAKHACPGFPDLALALRGSAASNLGTLKTNLNLLDYIKSNTPFTVEMFMSQTFNTAANWQSRDSDLISLGGYDYGFRFPNVIWNPVYGSAFGTSVASHTAWRTVSGLCNSRGISRWTEAQFNGNNGNDFFYHIVLQYDPVLARLEFFVNGIMISHWSTFTPTANGMFLAFFGMLNNATDLTTSRQYDFNGPMDAELLIHEIVVTRAKRYNYANFIGKVPFARKRFTT